MATVEVRIKPGRRHALSLAELWRYRELFYFFTWRDVKVRYKQTLIGAGWAILQPFVAMVVFTIFFHNVAGVQSGSSVPYALFSYSGLLFYNYFSTTLGQVSSSLTSNAGPLTKIYFPRIIPPIASTLLGIVDFFFAALIFVFLFIYYGVTPTWWGVLLVPPMLLLSLVFALGFGTLLAAVNVRYRDVRSALPFLLQIFLFITPVIYPVTAIPAEFRWLISLNPMTGVVTTMRAGLIGQGTVPWGELALGTAVAIATLVAGFAYFSRTEKGFADII